MKANELIPADKPHLNESMEDVMIPLYGYTPGTPEYIKMVKFLRGLKARNPERYEKIVNLD